MTPKALGERITALISSVNLLHRQALLLPSMIMTYAAIDIMGALGRPAEVEETTGADFRAWVDRYLLPGSKLKCTAHDLWGARCGLMHGYVPESRHSRAGKARKLVYIRGVLDEAARPKLEFVSGNYVVVVSQDLFDALSAGLQRFLNALETDQDLAERVNRRAERFYVMSPPETV